jgi:hypothetical protein
LLSVELDYLAALLEDTGGDLEVALRARGYSRRIEAAIWEHGVRVLLCSFVLRAELYLLFYYFIIYYFHAVR